MSSTVPRDLTAGLVLRELRENRGLSPEQMPFAMLRAGLEPVSGKTIRRIERGAIPQVRVKFALAQFYGRDVSAIWIVRRQRVAA
jgi:transcriptional regulator with XRE-family HTH domain